MSEPYNDQFLKDFYQSPRPEFGDALLKKLSAEPKRQPHRLYSLLSWFTMPRPLRQLAVVCLLLMGLFGLWSESMQTMALMTVAVFLAVAIGIPLGILAARRRRPTGGSARGPGAPGTRPV